MSSFRGRLSGAVVATVALSVFGVNCQQRSEAPAAKTTAAVFSETSPPPAPSPCPAASATSSCTLHAWADTSVYSKQPTDAGKRKILCVANVTTNVQGVPNGGIVRSLFAFDVRALPAGAQVTGAALTLHSWRAGRPTVGGPASVPLALYKQGATGGWDEGSATTGPDNEEAPNQVCIWAGDGSLARASFVNSNAATLDASTVATASSDQDFTFSSAAMVADVNSWISGVSTNNGWSVRLLDETQGLGAAIAPRETTQVPNGETRGPRLLLTYRKAAGQTCSTTAECASGVCVGGVCCGAACSPTDAQCQTAACTAGTGACVRTNKANNLICNDSKACTVSDVCTGGVCGGTFSCPAPAVCKTAATCPANGTCTYGNIAVNTPCNDGNPATTGETCDGAGHCVLPLGQPCTSGTQCNSTFCVSNVCCGASACTPANPQCQTAACGAGTGACVTMNKTNGTLCSDSNACTTGDQCSAGACTHTGIFTCAAPPTCHMAGVCQTANGSCTYALAAPGTVCNDGNPATTGEKCDTSGNCVVPPVAWSTPVTLDSVSCCFGAPLQQPLVAIAPNGDAMATWMRANQSGDLLGYYSIAAAHYSAASLTWGAFSLENQSTRPVTDSPRVALDGSGNGTVMWDDWDPTFFNTTVWSRTAGTTGVFGSAISPEPAQPLGMIAQMGTSAGGTVFSAWASGDNSGSPRVPHWGTLGSGVWTGPKTFPTTPRPLLVLDGQNNAIATWTQLEGGRYNPYWSRFNGASWTAAARLDPVQGGTGVWMLNVAVSSNGNAVASWIETDSATSSVILVRTFTPAGGWSATTTTLATITNSTIYAAWLALDAGGDAVLIWQIQDSATTSIFSKYSVAGGAWGSQLLVQSQPKANGFFQTGLAIDATGTATVPTMPTGGAIKVQRLTRGATAWSTPVTVDTPTAQFPDQLISFAVSPNGQGVLAWLRSPNTGNTGFSILASTFH